MKGALLTVGAVPIAATLGVCVLAGGVASSPLQASQAATTTGGCVLRARAGHFTAHLRSDQVANAITIDAVGRNLAIPTYGEQIALATALQESGLTNVPYGDRDSLGLFQQRPSQGWGTPAQVLDPVYAATQFYRHLLAVPGWTSLPLTVAAQAVQHSAYPDGYAKWQTEAATLEPAVRSRTEATVVCHRWPSR